MKIASDFEARCSRVALAAGIKGFAPRSHDEALGQLEEAVGPLSGATRDALLESAERRAVARSVRVERPSRKKAAKRRR